MNNEENMKFALTEEELKSAAGGEGELIIGHCPSCGVWWDATNSKVCPRCGTKV